jgi:hypothetical protein
MRWGTGKANKLYINLISVIDRIGDSGISCKLYMDSIFVFDRIGDSGIPYLVVFWVRVFDRSAIALHPVYKYTNACL